MSPDPTRIQTVLVIDDNLANRQVAAGHLVAAGYAVELAETGPQGIAKFKERTPDLVLLDILMPGMDGFETCRHLKLLVSGRDTPIVFLTALADLGSHHKAIESGADDFLTKPINRTELLIRVRSLLWVKRLKDDLSAGYDLIRSQRDALVHAQQQKEELSAMVVHDLKNPLTAILANVELVASEPYLDDMGREALHDVMSSAQSMNRMIMNLLDISRSEDGTMIPRPADLALDTLVAEVCKSARQRCAEHKITMEVSSGVKTIRADKDLLQRLIENLLDNGIKYSPPGGTLRIRTLADGGFVEICVDDDGAGIPEEFREKIFEKYFQVGGAQQARTSRGLGLAFCRLAAEAHGGKIWVEAGKPTGSSFCVRLPAR